MTDADLRFINLPWVPQKGSRSEKFATGGAWQAVRIPATDGADAFLGRQGELVAFAPDGTIFRGRIGSYRLAREGIELDYSKLVKL